MRLADIIGSALEARGIFEAIHPIDTDDRHKCLTDGQEFLWVYADDDGFVDKLVTRKGGDRVFILRTILLAFETCILTNVTCDCGGLGR